MKKVINIFIISSILLGSLYSCKQDEKDPFPNPQDTKEERGVFLRTQNTLGIVDFEDLTGSTWTLTGELVSDQATLAKVTNVQIRAWFNDLSKDTDPETEDDDSILEDVLVSTADISAFTKNDDGYLQGSIVVNFGTVITNLGMDPAIIEPGDGFGLRVVINTSEGRSFRYDNVTPDIGLPAFGAPFEYAQFAACIQKNPKAGAWIIDTQDSYGDGWQGGQITMNIDGVNTNYVCETTPGPQTIHTVNVPEGTGFIAFTYTPGAGNFAFEDENTYQVSDPDGTEIINEGPIPFSGSVLCPH